MRYRGGIELGTVIQGKYRLVRRIGSGGQGEVFAAEHVELGARVAVKTLAVGDEEDGRRFMREARIAASLESEHIVKVMDVGTLPDGAPFIVMELLKGRSLEHALADGAMSDQDLARLIGQVCHALSAAHAAGIVHRDVKPANIFVRENGNACLVDFGIARGDAHPSLTETGTALGTPKYMAPEQIRSSRTAGPAADVYAVCVVLYRCFSGRFPFDASELRQLLSEQKNRVPVGLDVLVPRLPAELVRAVAAGLSYDPAARPSVDDLAAVLAKIANEGSDKRIVIGGPSELAPTVRAEKQKSRLFVWALVGTIGTGAGVALLAVTLSPADDDARSSDRHVAIDAGVERDELAKRPTVEGPKPTEAVSSLHVLQMSCYERWIDDTTTEPSPPDVCAATLAAVRTRIASCAAQLPENCILHLTVKTDGAGRAGEVVALAPSCTTDGACYTKALHGGLLGSRTAPNLNLNVWR